VCLAIPIAVAADIPPGRIDFGNANTLQRLVTAMPGALWLAQLSLIGPTIALGTGIGWYQVLRTVGSYVAFGVALWYLILGMVLVVTQDAVEVAIVDYLPSAYVAADASLRPSLLALGAGASRSLDMVAAVGDSLSFLGLALINVALWRYRRTLRPSQAWDSCRCSSSSVDSRCPRHPQVYRDSRDCSQRDSCCSCCGW
jgi:hypothetical protein